VYCAEKLSTTDDHIFASKLFLLEDRGNLPEAPACGLCNNIKSHLEHYLLSVLPFGGRHSQAVVNLQSNVPKRLAKNRKLYRELSSNAQSAWLKDGPGIYQPTGVISFDGAKLGGLLKYIARGLVWHHWGVYLGADFPARVLFPPDMLSLYLQQQMHTLNEESKVTSDLGRGTVQYEIARASNSPDLFLLVISIYGGIQLSNGSGRFGEPRETSRHWWVITGHPELSDQIAGLK
jgi:hypothetical protein